MVQGIPAVFNKARVVRNFHAGMTLTKIAKIERVHLSCISKFLKKQGFAILPSRGIGPSPSYRRDQRISNAKERVASISRTLGRLGVELWTEREVDSGTSAVHKIARAGGYSIELWQAREVARAAIRAAAYVRLGPNYTEGASADGK